MSEPVLSVRGLSVDYPATGGRLRALREVSFEVGAGRALGVVGEWSPSGFLLHAIHEAVAGRCVVDPAFVDHVDPDGGLTRLESEVLALIGRGYTNQEIARALHRSVRSVEMHRAALVRKIGSRRRSDLVRTARMMGLAG